MFVLPLSDENNVRIRLAHPAVKEIACWIPADGSIVIGRAGGEVDLEINWDAKISRRHARVWFTNGQPWFSDLGSKNGSWLGDVRIERAIRLAPRAAVRIGDTTFFAPEPDVVGENLPGLELLRMPSLAAAHVSTDDLQTSRLEAACAPDEVAMISVDRVLLRFRDASVVRRWCLRDVVAGGTFLGLKMPPAVGRRITIEIHAPAGQFSLRAVVVHALDAKTARRNGLPPGAGVAFDLDARSRAHLLAQWASSEALALAP